MGFKKKKGGDAPDNSVPFQGASYYQELGIELRLDQATLKPLWPDQRKVEQALRRAAVAAHPLQHPTEEAEWQEARFRQVMEAGLVLLDPHWCETYHACLTSDAGHGGFLRDPARPRYTVEEIPDWLDMVVGWLEDDAADSWGDEADTITVAACLDVELLPVFVPGERLAHRPAYDVGAVIDQVLEDYAEEFAHLRMLRSALPRCIAWTWKRKAWKSQGATAVGKARKLSDKERARMPGTDAERPLGELQLSLSFWIAADDEARLRLIFHELCHFDADNAKKKLVLKAHDIETFAAEMRVFGIRDLDHAEVIAAALTHPATSARLADFGVLPDDQLVLFRDRFAEALALDDYRPPTIRRIDHDQDDRLTGF